MTPGIERVCSFRFRINNRQIDLHPRPIHVELSSYLQRSHVRPKAIPLRTPRRRQGPPSHRRPPARPPQLVKDYTTAEFRNNILAHAELGKLFNLPVVMTTSAETGPNGPLPKEITEMYPDAPFIKRNGEVNA